MDAEGIIKEDKNGVLLSLNNRLQKFKKIEDEELLTAIRKIGNQGSHKTIEIEYVLKAYNLIEYVLELLYKNRKENYSDIAKEVILELKTS